MAGCDTEAEAAACATTTGLVRVQATLDALHHGRTGEAAEDGVEVKRALEDRGEHRGNVLIVQRDDNGANAQVDDRHDGNEQAGHLGETTRATEDGSGHKNGENGTDNPRRPLVCPAVLGERVGDVEGGEQVEAAHVGQDEDGREERGQPVLLEGRLDVVGRAAVGVVRAALLVDLRERRLDECGRAAEGCDNPHPEDSAGATRGNGDGDTGDVTDADARGRRYHEGAERRNLSFFVGWLSDDADGLLEQTQRQRARTHEEVQADANQKGDEHVRIHKAVDRIEGAGKIESRAQGAVHGVS